ncbi:MAG TPA: hypothetical protein VFE57_10085, partial [Cyclobacteriaceae bacterium]|nr:hypothetical protein [Cyclobacteriaceae bacterium]
MKKHVTTLKPAIVTSSLVLLLMICTAASMMKPDFTGEWTLDRGKSNLGEFGDRMAPGKLSVKVQADVMTVVRNVSSPMGETVTTDKITLDGKESLSSGGREGSTRKTTSKLSDDQNSIIVNTVTNLTFDGNAFEIKATEKWALSADGKTLTIDVKFSGP